jgi:glycyl-tRNA synthetase
MEMQYFIKPGTQKEFFKEWQEIRWQWHLDNGLRESKLRWKDHGKQLAHYADAAFDIEYQFPIGWEEMEGIHSRTDFDLVQHQKFCGKNLQYVDQMDNNKKYIPFVIETSVGCDRSLLAVMSDAYRVENKGQGEEERTVMRFKSHLAPIKVAVLPLVKKAEIDEPAKKVFFQIQKSYKSEYDSSSSIGKRYRRQDEIGTPLCVTFDYDSLNDHAVTVRDRDTMVQERVSIDQLMNYFRDKLGF